MGGRHCTTCSRVKPGCHYANEGANPCASVPIGRLSRGRSSGKGAADCNAAITGHSWIRIVNPVVHASSSLTVAPARLIDPSTALVDAMQDGRLEGIVLKGDRSWYEREAWRFDRRLRAKRAGLASPITSLDR